MARSYHTKGANGCTCDLCQTPLAPFQIFRLVGRTLQPGPRYPQVTSDTTSKDIDVFHYCEDCYNIIIESLKQAKR